MRMLVLSYLHAEAGAPVRGLLGLPVATRVALYAQKAGVTTLRVLVRAEDVAATQARFEAEKRLNLAWKVSADPADAEGADWVALGDRIHLTDAFKAAFAAQDALADDAGLAPGAPTPAALLEGRLPSGGARSRKPSWTWLRGEQDRDPCERMLIRSLTKDADGVVSRNINRKISGFFSRRLASTNVSPNHVTGVVAILGLASAPFAAQGTWLGFAIAGLLYYISAILDGVDGELSRLKFLGSPLGAWLDTITDDSVCTAFLVGLYYGLVKATGLEQWTWIGVATISCFLLTVVPRYYLLIKAGGGGNHQILTADDEGEKGAFGKLVDVVAATFFRTDFLPFFAAVTCVAGGPHVFGYCFAVGSVLAMIETGFTFVKFTRRQAVTPTA